MATHKEIGVEAVICDHLAAHGWLDAAAYDRERALFPADLIAWAMETQAKPWADAVAKLGQAPLLDRIRKSLDERGTLEVLRKGVEIVGLKSPLMLAQFRPAMGMNPDMTARFTANRLRVIRQLRYSLHNEKCIDLGLFLNGSAVATVELKTDFTQSVRDAVDQYRFDRRPVEKGKKPEPLLAFPGSALVHFAVSDSEVMMAAKLEGPETRFLPFNKGDHGAAGNPLNPNGHRTAYLWEEIWARDSWLEILGRYLVGEAGKGLHCMFHMMNEARIGVGMAATMLGMAGYHASLDYAKNRPQGRPVGPGGKDAAKPQIRIIEHADVKRMLLAQKSYCEGALALELYCARLVDEQHTGTPEGADDARLLLEVLTPIAKSWPSEWCLEANSLAIQVHGGYGYTRDFPVEQYWRDNRLNMIHEGTHGIQGMDLLGRKVLMENGRGLQLLVERIQATIGKAGLIAELAPHAGALSQALEHVGAAPRAAWATGNPTDALANAVPYLQAFGHTVLAWIWLDVALASRAAAQEGTPAHAGRMAAARYFFHYELPKIGAWLKVVASRDLTCAELAEDAF